jgi:hypothetical protein
MSAGLRNVQGAEGSGWVPDLGTLGSRADRRRKDLGGQEQRRRRRARASVRQSGRQVACCVPGGDSAGSAGSAEGLGRLGSGDQLRDRNLRRQRRQDCPFLAAAWLVQLAQERRPAKHWRGVGEKGPRKGQGLESKKGVDGGEPADKCFQRGQVLWPRWGELGK